MFQSLLYGNAISVTPSFQSTLITVKPSYAPHGASLMPNLCFLANSKLRMHLCSQFFLWFFHVANITLKINTDIIAEVFFLNSIFQINKTSPLYLVS